MSDDLPVKAPASKPTKRFTRLKELTRWRRVSIGMWTRPTHSTVYGEQRFDVSRVLPFIQEVRDTYSEKVTVSHVVVKAVGDLFREYPHFNVMLRRRRFYQRATADVFMQVAIKEGAGDLGGIKISAVDQKTIVELAREVAERAEKVRTYQDKDLEKTKRSLQSTPPLLMPLVIRTVDILTNDLGANLSFLGVRPDAFGGAMVTNIGSFGLTHGYAPLVPASRVPVLITVGAVRDEPVAIEGKVEVRPMLTMTGTFDHRIFDGFQLAQMVNHVKDRVENPEWLRDELEARGGAEKAKEVETREEPGEAPQVGTTAP